MNQKRDVINGGKDNVKVMLGTQMKRSQNLEYTAFIVRYATKRPTRLDVGQPIHYNSKSAR